MFVGYGIVAPEHDYNDYGSADVTGAIAVFLSGEPPWRDRDGESPRASVHSWPEIKRRTALSHGARGSILLETGRSGSGGDWQQRLREYAFERLSLAYGVSENLSVIWNPERATMLFARAPHDWRGVCAMDSAGQMRSFPLNVSATFEGEFHERDFVAERRRPAPGTISAGRIRAGLRPLITSGPGRRSGDAICRGRQRLRRGAVLEIVRAARDARAAPSPPWSQERRKAPRLAIAATIRWFRSTRRSPRFERGRPRSTRGCARSWVRRAVHWATCSAVRRGGRRGRSVPASSGRGGFVRSDQLSFAQAGSHTLVMEAG
jgi:hypothetical protein